jgi:prepilin signal peptidase PulO-like enzyme (type II secretory pathway)
MTYNYIFAFILGSAWGSFFHTLAARYINGELTEKPFRALFSRSRCPACGGGINPAGLLPVLGYLVARGKCSHCGARVSPAYPLSEIAHGFLAMAALNAHGPGPLSVTVYFTLACSLTLSWIDIKTMIIPDFLNAGVLLFGLYPALTLNTAADSLYGFLLMLIFFVIVMLIFPGAFGGGDLKFAAVSGFFLGIEQAAVMLEVSLIAGAVTGTAWAVFSGKGFRSKIPFGPFLAAGLLIAHFFGRDILLLYYSWIG